MAQQTQMSRVLERWPEFLTRFPNVQALAAAPLETVLEAWRGMGYYRRARHLHAAAIAIVERFNARVPERVEDLLTLPGIGRYTAGAIASMAYGHAAPIVDGNVARVLLRIRGTEAAATDRAVQSQLWDDARRLVEAAPNPGVFNEALMELGATVCVPAPATPKCDACPWRASCAARALGKQLRIPTPKAAARQRVLFATSLVVTRESDGAMLLQKRSDVGMWAGLWQPPTVESDEGEVPVENVAAAIGVSHRSFSLMGETVFHATHREVRFRVFVARVTPRSRLAMKASTSVLEWVSSKDVGRRAMSNAHRQVLAIASGVDVQVRPSKKVEVGGRRVRRATIARSG